MYRLRNLHPYQVVLGRSRFAIPFPFREIGNPWSSSRSSRILSVLQGAICEHGPLIMLPPGLVVFSESAILGFRVGDWIVLQSNCFFFLLIRSQFSSRIRIQHLQFPTGNPLRFPLADDEALPKKQELEGGITIKSTPLDPTGHSLFPAGSQVRVSFPH